MFCTDFGAMCRELPGWAARVLKRTRTVTFLRHREALGDTIEVSALVRNLKKVRPGLRIAVVTRRPEIFRHNPHVDEAYGWHLMRAGMTVRAGYSGKDMFVEEHVVGIQWRRLWEELDQYGMPSPAGDGVAPKMDGVHPEIFLSEAEKEAGRALLAPLRAHGKPVVLLSSTGKLKPVHNREWGVANYQEVVKALAPFVSLAQAGGEEVLTLGGKPLAQFGGLPVRQAAGLFAASDAFLVQEGGLMHLASAVGTPVAAIFGGTLLPSQTGYEANVNFWSKPACSPCLGKAENCAHLKCMAPLTPRKVVEGIAQLLARRRGFTLPREAAESAPDRWEPPAFVDRAALARELSQAGAAVASS
ncbi:MAG: glycosyltransferase family 9 protein [Planctomycetota bacterium]|nr:glycosyltransferase family 9 protein [Planctomycetota bacterium]